MVDFQIQHPDNPDFERFLTAIRGGCADRVPIAEALIDNQIKAAILGRPVLDLADDVLAKLDLVVGTIHSYFSLSLQKQTERILRAMDSSHYQIQFCQNIIR